MKTNLTKKHSGRITFAVLLAFFMMAAFAASAEFKPIVTNDPSGDAGAMGIDIKNLSYEISADKKDITLKFESYNAVSNWSYSGFTFYIDDDCNPATGITPACANKSMKADRSIMCVNMMGMWMSELDLASGTKTDISSSVTISMPDSKTTLVKIPLAKFDSNADGKFNLLVGSVVAGSTTSYIDDLPNSNYSSLDVLNTSTTSIAAVSAGGIKVAVYPNPAINAVNFTSADAVSGNVSLFNLAGQVVAQTSMNGTSATIVTDQLAAGTYLYRIADANGQLLEKGNLAVAH